MTNSDIIQIILMALLVVVTGIYAWRTFAISKSTEKQANNLRETISMSVRPFISLEIIKIIGGDSYLFEPPHELYIELQNTGKGPARNLVLTCVGQGKKVEYTKKELPSLNVGDKPRYSIHRTPDISESKLKVAYVVVEALYNDELGEIWSTTLEIDRQEGKWESGEIITEERCR